VTRSPEAVWHVGGAKDAGSSHVDGPERSSLDTAGENHVLSLHAEQILVSRRKVDEAIVRVSTVTRSQEQTISEELTREKVDVQRVPIGRFVDAVPPIREEGDLTIMSVVEEVVVVERLLLLREEIHIRRSRTTEMHTETVSLRKQEAVITRRPVAAGNVS
jgi:stress response protein YsnF